MLKEREFVLEYCLRISMTEERWHIKNKRLNVTSMESKYARNPRYYCRRARIEPTRKIHVGLYAPT